MAEPTDAMMIEHLDGQVQTLLAENRKLRAAIVGINIALARDENLDAGARLAIEVRKELQF